MHIHLAEKLIHSLGKALTGVRGAPNRYVILIQEKNAPGAPCLAGAGSVGAVYQTFHSILPEDELIA